MRTGHKFSSVRIFIIMNITDLQIGERGEVLAVSCEEALKERLRSLNIHKEAVLRLVKISFFKKTYLMQAGGSLVALRREVAQCVEIRKV